MSLLGKIYDYWSWGMSPITDFVKDVGGNVTDKVVNWSSNMAKKIFGSDNVEQPTTQKNFDNISSAYDSSSNGEETETPTLNDNSAYNSADFLDYLKNMYSGNLDYDRTLELMQNEMDFNSAEAQKNRDFQERMSNTSYQRAVADLKSAGFNPALIVGQGGASSPTSYNASVGSHSAISSGTQMTQLLTGIVTSAFDVVERIVGNVIPNISQIYKGKVK